MFSLSFQEICAKYGPMFFHDANQSPHRIHYESIHSYKYAFYGATLLFYDYIVYIVYLKNAKYLLS